MPKPVALYYDMLQYQEENLRHLEAHFDLRRLPTPAEDTDALLSQVELCFAPLGYRVDQAKIARCPRLAAIATNTTGVPHIDVGAAKARGIAVYSLQYEQAFLDSITPTAEHAWGLLLALVRRTPWAHGAVLDGRWNRRPFGAPAMLSRLKLGVVGYGRLGKMVAQYGQAFRMPVRFHDPALASDDGPVRRVANLTELFAWADVLSLHLPANEQTHKIVNRAALNAMRKGTWLINTARGEVLDETALLDKLEDGTLAGAALDVLDGEFVPGFDAGQHPLVAYAREHDNLLLTPHIGGSTRDAWAETERRVIDRAVVHFSSQGDRGSPSR